MGGEDELDGGLVGEVEEVVRAVRPERAGDVGRGRNRAAHL